MNSVTGTITNAPDSNTLTLSGLNPALTAGYNDLFKGMKLRPDLAYTNGTAGNWTDDNVVTVTANTDAQFTTTASGVAVPNSATFRSIDILDHFDIGNGTVLQTYGDIYTLSGPFQGGSYSFTDVVLNMSGSGSYNFNLLDLVYSRGTIGFSFPLNARNLTVSGATITAPSVTLSENLVVSSGVLTTPAMNVTGNATISGGTGTINNLDVTGNVTISGGTLTHPISTTTTVNKLQATIGGDLTMNGGTISANGVGYPAGYSFGAAGPSISLAPTPNSGASHGGQGGLPATAGATYGNYRNPSLPGASVIGGTYFGGGVIRLDVTGACAVNSGATITANASAYYGAGGSIYANCASFSGTAGTNAITANGGNAYSPGGYGAGGGGRIALISKAGSTSFSGSFTYPTDSTSLTNFKTKVRVWGGRAAGAFPDGGAGTIYIKHNDQTHGSLIVDNGLTGLPTVASPGTTFLPSLAGTVNGAPGANTLPVAVTSSPALVPSFSNLYAGMKLRPDLSNNNGTANNWADDNVLTVTANTSTELTTSEAIAGVVGGASFRSIDIFDNLDVGGGATLQSNGDIYVLNGPLSAPGASTIDLANSLFELAGSASTNLAMNDFTFSGGTVTLTKPFSARSINVSGASTSITAPSISVTQNLTVSNGTLTSTSNTTVGGSVSVSGGTFVTNGLNVTGNVTLFGGTLKHNATTATTVNKLEATIGGYLNLTGGAINVNGLGYLTGYSYGATGPSTLLASGANAGASHGGRGGNPNAGATYDNFRNPSFPGAGINTIAGGGVARMNVTGTCKIDTPSTITANAGGLYAAGGSIYLNCGGFSGTAGSNAITANGGNGAGVVAGGGGGRIAMISSGGAVTFSENFTYPTNAATLTAFKGKVRATGGTAVSAAYPEGGPGTIFLKHSGLTYGDLIIVGHNPASTNPNGGTTEFVSATDNTSTLFGRIDTNTAQVTPASLPYVNKNNIFAGELIHFFFNLDSTNPLSSSPAHTFVTLTGNGDNSFITNTDPFPAISNDYNYRFLVRLDHLDISDKAIVNLNGADLVTQACDLHSVAATTFDVPASSKLTGNVFSSPSCINGSVTTKGTTVNFGTYYLQ